VFADAAERFTPEMYAAPRAVASAFARGPSDVVTSSGGLELTGRVTPRSATGLSLRGLGDRVVRDFFFCFRVGCRHRGELRAG
jgi:hypothetical protein